MLGREPLHPTQAARHPPDTPSYQTLSSSRCIHSPCPAGWRRWGGLSLHVPSAAARLRQGDRVPRVFRRPEVTDLTTQPPRGLRWKTQMEQAQSRSKLHLSTSLSRCARWNSVLINVKMMDMQETIWIVQRPWWAVKADHCHSGMTTWSYNRSRKMSTRCS